MRIALGIVLLALNVGLRLAAVELPLRGPLLAGEQGAIDPVANHRPVLVVFWASWCDSCVREMPSLLRFHRAAAGRVDLVSCTIDSDVADAKASVAKHRLSYPVILDGDMKIADRFGVDGTPALFLLGADGKILASGRSLAQLAKALDKMGVAVP